MNASAESLFKGGVCDYGFEHGTTANSGQGLTSLTAKRLFDEESVRESNLMNLGYSDGLFLGYSVNFPTSAAVQLIIPSTILVDM
jgi:hypothetical protein